MYRSDESGIMLYRQRAGTAGWDKDRPCDRCAGADYVSDADADVIPCGSVVLRKEIAQEFGFVCDRFHEDYILWLRVLKKYKTAAGINVPALKCRLSEGGKSRNKWKSAQMQYGSYRYLGYGRLQAFYYMIFYTLHGCCKYWG